MSPPEHEPRPESAESHEKIEQELQVAEALNREIDAVSARMIAAELATSADSDLAVFAATGSLHPPRALKELADSTHDLAQIRRVVALTSFIEQASPLRPTKPEVLELEPASAVYLAPPSGLGSWVQLNRDREEVRQTVRRLQHGRGPSAPPWTVQAYAGFYDLPIEPDEDLDTLLEVAEGLETQGEYFAAYAQYMGIKRATIDELAARYHGCYQSIDEFVLIEAERRGWLAAIQQLNNATGLGGLLTLDPDAVAARYFDTDAYGDWRQIHGRWGIHVLGPPTDSPEDTHDDN